MARLACRRAVVVRMDRRRVGGTATSKGMDGWLEDHNYFRCLHNADPVGWDYGLESQARPSPTPCLPCLTRTCTT